MYSASRYAFSLVELSIVLVILGLLTGGILTGQSLIKAAELRNVMEEYKSLNVAVFTFKNKYHQLPGDINNAVAFWGAAADPADPTLCTDAIFADNGIATCNGNGNGHLGQVPGDVTVAAQIERALFWHHLANAGLINRFPIHGKQHSTCIGDATCVLKTKLRNNVFIQYGVFFGSADLMLGKPFPGDWGVADWLDTGLSVLEAHSIDKKFDDGIAYTGLIWGDDGSCRVGGGSEEYNFAYEGDDACVLFIGTDWASRF